MDKKAIIFDMYGVFLRRDFFLREREDMQMTALAQELKQKGVKLILLSNIYIRKSDFYKKYQFPKLFDALYFSSDMGFAKPDPRAFELVLREQQLAPQDAIFFDDMARNVAAAQALGIESHVFIHPDTVRACL